MARRPTRRLVLGLAVVVVVASALVWWGLHVHRERELARGWQELVALAAGPSPPPAGTLTAARFAKDLALFIEDEDPDRAEAFSAWLLSPGLHHLRSTQSPGLSDMVRYRWDLKDRGQILQVILEGAGRRLATRADPALLPGLLELAARLRREGGWRELGTGLDLTLACLQRLDGLGAEAPPIPPAWAPTLAELEHAKAVTFVRLEQRVAAGRFHDESTAWHPQTGAARLAAELRRAVVLDPTLQVRRPAGSSWREELISTLFGPARDEVERLRIHAHRAGQEMLGEFYSARRRWRDVLGPLPDDVRADAR